ncbi:MAG: hypothetical protein L0332_32125 [Chloroflexi bacterium]|nr:hypothetical protein [Chloroflexota bacterium]MCI0577235.1 hypothetical protein [Chloroflexota bacterium]MCI0646716.1 hypothetical protein [Chloroflexota bacterium]MCI0731350.1 hypothetical protein [Chloroflexota bacterium]
MSKYVRCVNNPTLFVDDLAEDYAPHLILGQVYKVAPPEENDGDMVRVIDGSGESYLYPAEYFEPFLPDSDEVADSITVHLDAYMKGVLHAEAIVARKSISALVREWIDGQLDLPVGVD